MEFNHESRKKNIIRTSLINCICKVVQMAAVLGYRMFFLRILTVEYLGLSGLFTNILGVLCLADAGISGAIIYRLYKPISTDDTKTVGQLMRFFKRSYSVIALIITVAGCAVAFFLKYLIRDTAESLNDINIYTVYFLFLFETVSSYFFSYKFALLNADQRANQNTIISTFCMVFRHLLQLVVLLTTKNYTLTLGIGIATNTIINYVAGLWVSSQYPGVFSEKSDLPDLTKKRIYTDTKITLLHRIGGTVHSSTDNILLTKFIGLSVTGIYSNYSMVIGGISGIIGMALSALAPSLGNAHVSLKPEERYRIYKKALFVNFWLISLASVCLYNLVDDFIFLWLGKNLFLDRWTVLILCIQFYIDGVRNVTLSYTVACGLYIKDKAMPIVEALLNLGVSIIFLRLVGTPGIFIGTIISDLFTVFWREPHRLYKYAFYHDMKDYWLLYAKYTVLTVATATVSASVKSLIFHSRVDIVSWIITGFITVALFEMLHMIVFFKDQDFRYYLKMIFRRTL